MVTFQTTVDSKSGDLEGVRSMVSALERARSLPPETVFDINVVLDELISNIIKYGYSDDAAHGILVRLAATDTVVEIGIEDDGKAFDPFALPEPDLSLPLAERPVGGLGLHFVRKLMDDIEYKRENNRNYMFLKKNLTPQAQG
jgi:serine/threonine-protein kinase RsbW